jgi:hypothetical protein
MLRVKEIKNNNNGTIYLDPYYIDYLCFTDASGSSNTLTLTKTDTGNAYALSLEYSTDKVNWTTWTETNNVRTYTIPANGKVYLRGTNANGICYGGSDFYTLSSTKNINASGNIMTIVDSVGRTGAIPTNCFRKFFLNMTTLLSAPSFGETSMTLNGGALVQMFEGCSNMTTAPSIVISTLIGSGNCNDTFKNCSSLTDASNINITATNIPNNAFWATFLNCTSLTKTPIFSQSVLSLGANALRGTFNGCTTLTTAPSLTISSMSGTYACCMMFNGCTSLTSASNIKLNATAIPDSAYEQMFNGCTSLTTPPTITSSALTIGGRGFNQMFNGCTALISTPTITIGSFTSGTNLHCANMFNECTSLTTVNMQLNATTLYLGSYKLMFNGCTSLVNAPEIKATTLNNGDGNIDNGSLAYMFRGCSKLNTIKVHFTSWNSGAYTKQWTYGTKSTGTFYKPSSLPSTKNASGNTTNAHYIPYNWTVTNI